MRQTNPDNVARVWPTLGLGVGPGETIDYPVLLPGMLPDPDDFAETAVAAYRARLTGDKEPAAETEPGCLHAECVLEHPHAGPAVLGVEGAAAVGAAPAKKTRAARRSL